MTPALYWRYRAACADLSRVQIENRLREQHARLAVAAALDAICADDPTFDRTKNYSADDATCELTPAEGAQC